MGYNTYYRTTKSVVVQQSSYLPELKIICAFNARDISENIFLLLNWHLSDIRDLYVILYFILFSRNLLNEKNLDRDTLISVRVRSRVY